MRLGRTVPASRAKGGDDLIDYRACGNISDWNCYIADLHFRVAQSIVAATRFVSKKIWQSILKAENNIHQRVSPRSDEINASIYVNGVVRIEFRRLLVLSIATWIV